MVLGCIRPAYPDDADAIARIQLTTWPVVYSRMLLRYVLDELDAEWLVAR